MLKLGRSVLSKERELHASASEAIKRKFVENLFDMQSIEGLHLANELTKTHAEWR